jgi:cupin fold WbuC family metalloprotein
VEIKNFSNSFLDELTHNSLLSTRKRKNYNIHTKYSDSCQRLFNAIGVDSYIPPHRHSLDSKHECLIAVSGLFALFIFDDNGEVLAIIKFGSDLYRKLDINCGVGVEISPNTWHTVIALSESAILFEVKEGPFDPLSAKEIAPWAPNECTPNSLIYFQTLKDWIRPE